MQFRCDFISEDGEVKTGIFGFDGEIYFEEKEVDAEYIVTPTFSNSHTHLADSVAMDIPYMSLDYAVSKNGLKFRFLEKFENEIENAIRSALEEAIASGTTLLVDFREGGLKGARIFHKADTCQVGKILARPSSIDEAEKMARETWIYGFGMSGVKEHPFVFLEEIREIARKHKKIFAIHAGEKNSEDVELALSLEPDILIHLNMAEIQQLKKIVESEIPVVSCIRSNAFFDLLNIKNYRFLSNYEKWMIGTDNAMISTPSILDEMKFASYIIRNDILIFKAAIRGFYEFEGKSRMGYIIFSKKRFKRTVNPLSTVVRRCDRRDIIKIVADVKKICY